jgi:hypothetical protein
VKWKTLLDGNNWVESGLEPGEEWVYARIASFEELLIAENYGANLPAVV